MSTETAFLIMAGLITVQSVALLMSTFNVYRVLKNLYALWKQMRTELWDLRDLIKSSSSTGWLETRSAGTSSANDNVDEKASGKVGSK